ncbi:MAG: hypothetical protein D8M59_10970 [Planctomycetes bacterium]|nr:hypothetical protein [Planctomycetota bacterium]NOG54128.1 hypothetical protein [Planctomycetota bacterium]
MHATMNKSQLVDAILGMNPTAAVEFLMSFNDFDLRHYLEHLQLTREPRGRRSSWVRQPDAPAIVWKQA